MKKWADAVTPASRVCDFCADVPNVEHAPEPQRGDVLFTITETFGGKPMQEPMHACRLCFAEMTGRSPDKQRTR